MMNIKQSGVKPPFYRSVTVRSAGPDGSSRSETRILPSEYTLNAEIPGEPGFTLTCTPSCLPELVLGHLLTEGRITGAADLKELRIDTDRHLAEIRLAEGRQPAETRLNGARQPAEGGAAPEAADSQNPQARSFSPDPEQFAALMRKLDQLSDTPGSLYGLTRAIHSCSLIYRGEPVFTAEDLRRHNAVDKVIGRALLRGIPLPECMLYTTGRMPADMVMKAVRAGVTALVSRKAPTAEGLQLAAQHAVRLLGITRDGRLLHYS